MLVSAMIEWFKLNIHLFVSNFDLENFNIVSQMCRSHLVLCGHIQ